MDMIFLSAALTIVCASEEDVHAGLKPHGTAQRVDPGPLVGPSLHSELKSTKSYSRGWIYQEFMLSKWLFIFAERQVSFQCHMQSFTDDHHRRWDIAQRLREKKPRGPAINQHPLWAIDNRHQLGDV